MCFVLCMMYYVLCIMYCILYSIHYILKASGHLYSLSGNNVKGLPLLKGEKPQFQILDGPDVLLTLKL